LYVHINIYIFVCIYRCIHTHNAYICIYTYHVIYIYMSSVYVRVNVCICIYMEVRIYIDVGDVGETFSPRIWGALDLEIIVNTRVVFLARFESAIF